MREPNPERLSAFVEKLLATSASCWAAPRDRDAVHHDLRSPFLIDHRNDAHQWIEGAKISPLRFNNGIRRCCARPDALRKVTDRSVHRAHLATELFSLKWSPGSICFSPMK